MIVSCRRTGGLWDAARVQARPWTLTRSAAAEPQVGAVQKYSSPDPVAGFLHRASLDLGLDAGTSFTHVSVQEVPQCWWCTRQRQQPVFCVGHVPAPVSFVEG